MPLDCVRLARKKFATIFLYRGFCLPLQQKYFFYNKKGMYVYIAYTYIQSPRLVDTDLLQALLEPIKS